MYCQNESNLTKENTALSERKVLRDSDTTMYQCNTYLFCLFTATELELPVCPRDAARHSAIRETQVLRGAEYAGLYEPGKDWPTRKDGKTPLAPPLPAGHGKLRGVTGPAAPTPGYRTSRGRWGRGRRPEHGLAEPGDSHGHSGRVTKAVPAEDPGAL